MDVGAELYQKYRKGDDAALAELIETYRSGLQLFLTSFTSDPQLAEDMTQETFLRLALKKPPFYGRSAFRTWLYRIGRNAAADAIRKRGRETPVDFSAISPVDDGGFDPEEAYLRAEETRVLYRAIEKLPPAYRQILWLVYFEDMPLKECAAVLHKSPNAAKTSLFRAKKALAEQLKREGYEDENKQEHV